MISLVGLVSVMQLVFVFNHISNYVRLKFTPATVVRIIPADTNLVGSMNIAVLRVEQAGQPAEEVRLPSFGSEAKAIGDTVTVAFSKARGYHPFSQPTFFRNLLYGVMVLAGPQLALCGVLLLKSIAAR